MCVGMREDAGQCVPGRGENFEMFKIFPNVSRRSRRVTVVSLSWTVRKLSKLGATVEWQGVPMRAVTRTF